jgi:hypothetical protein
MLALCFLEFKKKILLAVVSTKKNMGTRDLNQEECELNNRT